MNRPAILAAIESGRIIVKTDLDYKVNTSSINVRLGSTVVRVGMPVSPGPVDLRVKDPSLYRYERIGEGGLVLRPGDCFLAHTHEFIGGADDRIVTMIKDRSTLGRHFLTVYTGAGWGDVGYHNRWTLELKNNAPYAVRIPQFASVAQIIFMEGGAVDAGYSADGSYQQGNLSKLTFQELEAQWKPEEMLPATRW